MKKINEFFRNNIFTRTKIIISLTITAIFFLTVALFLTGCCLPNAGAGRQKIFRDVGPAWSPDGTKIAFVKLTYYNQDLNSSWGVIWVMNADGSNKVKLTGDTEKFNSPTWSPDGTKIAFAGPENKGDIWVMNADGSNRINFTGN